MGADLSETDFEWAKPKDLKMMDTEEQCIRICVMSPEEASNSIDAMIEDLTDTEQFNGLTSDDDFFDVGRLNPLNYQDMLCLKT